MARRWQWVSGLAVVLLVAWVVQSRTQAELVDAGVVSTGALRAVIEETGTTRVRDHADVNAPVAGRWVPAHLRAGDVVREKAPLGALYPAPMDASAQDQARARLGAAQSAQREAETRIAAAQTALGEAQRTLSRTERMAAAGGMSPQDLERARDAVSQSESELEAARLRARAATYDLESARAVVAPFSGNRDALRIVSPVGGTVLRVFEEHERVVAPGTPLMEVGDPRDLEVIVPMLTSDVTRVQVGAAVSMTFGAKSDTVRGTVSRVEPSAFTKLSALGVEEQRVNVVVTVPATDVHVGDQYRVHAVVTVWEASQVRRVPASALVRDGNQWFVYAIRDGRARKQPVTIGERSNTLVEVRDGLADGDHVVLYPSDVIMEGTRVRAAQAP